jgi:hypothetical protein
MGKREKPGLIVRKLPGGALSPVSAFDAERLASLAVGAEFNVTERSRRSVPQHRLYWEMLGRVVENMDEWPTSSHLHRALKQSLGYVTVNYDLSGKPFIEVDSTAFDAMTQSEFQVYFQKATEALAKLLGTDPLTFYSEAA